jgi:hypothetical protein
VTRRPAVVAAAVALALLVGGGALALVLRSSSDGPRAAELEVLDPDGEVDHDFVIPEGTARRIARGEAIEIVPQHLDVRVGESIRIRNEDTSGATVGIFYVGAGEVVRMAFTTPGELKGVCDVHPSGEFTITVHEA